MSEPTPIHDALAAEQYLPIATTSHRRARWWHRFAGGTR